MQCLTVPRRRRTPTRYPSTTRIIRRHRYSSPDVRRSLRRHVSFCDGAGPEGERRRFEEAEHPRRLPSSSDQPRYERPVTNEVNHDRYIRNLLAQNPPSGVYEAETMPDGKVLYRKVKDLSDDENEHGMLKR